RKLPLAALRASGLALPASVAAERPARARRLARVALRPEYACWFGRVRAAALPPVHCGPSHRLLRPARARCADAIARRPGRASAATRRLSPYLSRTPLGVVGKCQSRGRPCPSTSRVARPYPSLRPLPQAPTPPGASKTAARKSTIHGSSRRLRQVESAPKRCTPALRSLHRVV